jgi:hypothetical protein
MKTFQFAMIGLLISGIVAEARDWNPRKVPKIEGEVTSAIWKGAHQFKLMTIQDDDGKFEESGKWETTVTVAPSWFILLKNVVGLDKKAVREISRQFATAEPNCPVLSAEILEGSGNLLLRIAGGQDLMIRVGQRILLSDCTFEIDLLGVSMSHQGLKINPPAGADRKGAEQPGAGQPATQPADKVPAEVQPSTPTSKDAPR